MLGKNVEHTPVRGNMALIIQREAKRVMTSRQQRQGSEHTTLHKHPAMAYDVTLSF